MKASEETKKVAKELGIKSWHVKGEEKLQQEIALKRTESPSEGETTPEPTNVPSDAPSSTEERLERLERLEALLTLKGEMTWDSLAMKIALMGNRSQFFEYQDIIKEKLNGD